MKPWIGVDLDGTLAWYGHWEGPTAIGQPISLMVLRVRAWLNEGKDVRIFTARVFSPPDDPVQQKHAAESLLAIQKWCEQHIGKVLPVTCQKDFGMIELWDDRAVEVITNTGCAAAQDR